MWSQLLNLHGLWMQPGLTGRRNTVNVILSLSMSLHMLRFIWYVPIRFVTNALYRTHHCTLSSSVNWSSLFTRHKTHWLLLIYKTLLGLTPSHLSGSLVPNQMQSTFSQCKTHLHGHPCEINQTTSIPNSQAKKILERFLVPSSGENLNW